MANLYVECHGLIAHSPTKSSHPFLETELAKKQIRDLTH